MLYPVLDAIIAQHDATFAANSPLVNPTMADAGAELVAQSTWAAQSDRVTTTVKGATVQVRNTSRSTTSTPVTLPLGSTELVRGLKVPFGSQYAGELSSRVSVPGSTARTYQLPADPGFATTVTWSARGSQSAPDVPTAPVARVTAVVPQSTVAEDVLAVEPEAVPTKGSA